VMVDVRQFSKTDSFLVADDSVATHWAA
jgi:hypothetical protein